MKNISKNKLNNNNNNYNNNTNYNNNYCQLNRVYQNIEKKSRIEKLSMPKNGLSICVNPVYLKHKNNQRFSDEISYLINKMEKNKIAYDDYYNLNCIKLITKNKNDNYYIRKYNNIRMNNLIGNVLEKNKLHRKEIFPNNGIINIDNNKILDYEKRYYKNEKNNEIYNERIDQENQELFENFIKLKCVEEKYNDFILNSIKEIENKPFN